MHFRPRLNNEDRMSCARARPYGLEPSLFLYGTKLKKTDRTRFLGVIIDDQLTWDHHITYLEAKLNSQILMIKRIRKVIPESQYKNIYHTLFESHFI